MAHFEEGRGKGAARGGASARLFFPRPYGAGLNCAAPRQRSRDAEGAPTELIAVAEGSHCCWMEKANARSETKAAGPAKTTGRKQRAGGQLYEGKVKGTGEKPAVQRKS